MSKHYWPRVAVPARNEAGRLESLLNSLAYQTWQTLYGKRLPVVIVLNNCDDGSRQVLDQLVPHYPTLDLTILDVHFPPSKAHVGSARRLAMETACHCVADPARTVLMTTDADATPDLNWVAANIAAIEAGADVVGGEIVADRDEEERLGPGFLARAKRHKHYSQLADKLTSLIDPLPWDRAPRHSDHSGGSIAVTVQAYRAVGGMYALPFREDIDLVERLTAAGARLRHDPDVRVTVSARIVGRAASGMAECLRGWLIEEHEGRPHLVEDPMWIEQRAARRRAIRTTDLDDPDHVDELSRFLQVPRRKLFAPDGGPVGTGHLIRRFAPDELDAVPTVPVGIAIALINQRISTLEGQVHAA